MDRKPEPPPARRRGGSAAANPPPSPALRAVLERPTVEAGWSQLFRDRIIDHSGSELVALAELRQRLRGDALEFVHQQLAGLGEAGQFQCLEALAAAVPANNLCYPIALYYAGFAALRDRRESLGFARVAEASRLALQFRSVYAEAGLVRRLLFMPALLTDHSGFDEIAGLSREQAWQGVAPIEWRFPPARRLGLTVLAACNGPYFLEYAGTFCAALDRLGLALNLHLHVAQADAACLALMAELSGQCRTVVPSFSTEQPDRFDDAVSYSCLRFLQAAAIQDYFDSDLFISDVDNLLQPGFAALIPDCRRAYDFLCEDIGSIFPNLCFRAGLVYAARSPAGRHFLELLGRAVVARLSRSRVWTVDQASLFCCDCYLRAGTPGFRSGRLAEVTALPIEGIYGSRDSLERKTALRAFACNW
jgi:hypothetical protein